jgi:hypothetical protein
MIYRIANRIASSLSERPDYGHSNASLPRGMEHVSVITEESGKFCVRSEDPESNWSGGCYDSMEEAQARLNQVEMFKHIKK